MARVGTASVTPLPVRGYNWATMTDAALVRAALDGDSGAFTTLVDRHLRVCLRFATRMLGSVEDAEDATQETFLRAHRALARYDGSTEFRTWLISILLNRCRTMLRSHGRRSAVIVADDRAVASAAARSLLDDEMLRDAIERAVARLEPAQREAFLLRHVEQLSYEEMHQATGVGISALKMRVQRACDRLQGLLREDRHA
ncbi:MAG TPA: RNA polymerase sigma factor [Gemmatimonadaceae bacterium]